MPRPVVTSFRLNEHGILRIGPGDELNEIRIEGEDFDPDLASFRVSAAGLECHDFRVTEATPTSITGHFRAKLRGKMGIDPAQFVLKVTVANGVGSRRELVKTSILLGRPPMVGGQPVVLGFTLNGGSPGTMLYSVQGTPNAIVITGYNFGTTTGSFTVTANGFTISACAVDTSQPTPWSDTTVYGTFIAAAPGPIFGSGPPVCTCIDIGAGTSSPCCEAVAYAYVAPNRPPFGR